MQKKATVGYKTCTPPSCHTPFTSSSCISTSRGRSLLEAERPVGHYGPSQPGETKNSFNPTIQLSSITLYLSHMGNSAKNSHSLFTKHMRHLFLLPPPPPPSLKRIGGNGVQWTGRKAKIRKSILDSRRSIQSCILICSRHVRETLDSCKLSAGEGEG